jgi:serine/threonine-protein kinase HipA
LQKATLAMALRSRNAHYRLGEIQARHWQALAERAGGPAVFDAMVQLVASVEAAAGRLATRLPPDFPAGIAESIFQGMAAQAARFRTGL